MINGITKYNGLNNYIKPNEVLRAHKGIVYFFDDNMKWSSMPVEEAYDKGLKGVHKRRIKSGSDWYWIDDTVNTCLSDGETHATNGNLNRKIICRLTIGDDISKIDELADEVYIKEHEPVNYTELERFIGKIDRPIIYREPENKDEKTFDFVECTVYLTSYRDDIVDFFKQNRNEIDRMVVDKIANDKSFQKYGVPVNYLKLENIGISKQNYARYVFGLKTA